MNFVFDLTVAECLSKTTKEGEGRKKPRGEGGKRMDS